MSIRPTIQSDKHKNKEQKTFGSKIFFSIHSSDKIYIHTCSSPLLLQKPYTMLIGSQHQQHILWFFNKNPSNEQENKLYT